MANSERNQIFTHLTQTFLGTGKPSSPIKCLLRDKDCDDLDALMNLLNKRPRLWWEGAEGHNGKYVDNKGKTQDFPEVETKRLLALIPYMHYLQNNWGPKVNGEVDYTRWGRSDFLSYVQLDFDEDNPTRPDNAAAERAEATRKKAEWAKEQQEAEKKRQDEMMEYEKQLMEARINGLSGTAGTISPPAPSKASDFKKSTKRDQSKFKTFNEDYKWRSWQSHLTTQARAQGVSEILDPTYTPPDAEESAVFDLMQDYMFAVFHECLKTTKGISIVRKHEASGNAQAVYKELVEHYTKSMAAENRATTLLDKISTKKIPNNGPVNYQAAMALFNSWVEDYNEVSDTPLSESQRLKYLRHYISDVPKLGAVSTQLEFLKIGLGKPLSADETASVVETMALQLDGTAKQPPGTRRAYVTNIDFSEAGLATDENEPSYSTNTHNSL